MQLYDLTILFHSTGNLTLIFPIQFSELLGINNHVT